MAAGVPTGIAVDRAGRHVYASNHGVPGTTVASVSQFSIGADGKLAALTPELVDAGVEPGLVSVRLHPSGAFAYGIQAAQGFVEQFSVSADGGQLSPLTPSQVATGSVPRTMAIDPTGTYAYVPNEVSGNVAQFKIEVSGHLTPLTPPTVALGASSAPYDMVLTPDGKYAYVANNSAFGIAQFKVNADGTLSALAAGPVTAGTSTDWVGLDSTGRFLYGSDYGSYLVYQYAIGTGGALTPLSPATATSTTRPKYTLARGHLLYMAESDNLATYAIGVDGTLTPWTTYGSPSAAYCEIGILDEYR